MKKALILLASHAVVALAGFAAGIYLLPILIAPPAPDAAEEAAWPGIMRPGKPPSIEQGYAQQKPAEHRGQAKAHPDPARHG